MSGSAPITPANRLLVTAVGPARNPGMEYEKTERSSWLGLYWSLKSPGEGQALLEAIVGSLRVRNRRAADLKAWTPDVTGKRRGPVPLVVEDGAVVLKMQLAGQAVYYELAAK